MHSLHATQHTHIESEIEKQYAQLHDVGLASAVHRAHGDASCCCCLLFGASDAMSLKREHSLDSTLGYGSDL